MKGTFIFGLLVLSCFGVLVYGNACEKWAKGCPKDWTEEGPFCYKLRNDLVSYDEALSLCDRFCAAPAMYIGSSVKNMLRSFSPISVWISGFYHPQSKDFTVQTHYGRYFFKQRLTHKQRAKMDAVEHNIQYTSCMFAESKRSVVMKIFTEETFTITRGVNCQAKHKVLCQILKKPDDKTKTAKKNSGKVETRKKVDRTKTARKTSGQIDPYSYFNNYPKKDDKRKTAKKNSGKVETRKKVDRTNTAKKKSFKFDPSIFFRNYPKKG